MKSSDTAKTFRLTTSLLLALLTAVSLVSCDTVSSGDGGNPGSYDESLSIDGVRYYDADSVDEQGNPIRPDTLNSAGVQIAIEGQNMNSVQDVYFLGFEADFNPSIASEEHLIVSLPTVPFGELTASALDTLDAIRLENQSSAASYNEIPVLPSAPELEGMSNEHALPGDEVTIYGQSLYLVESITFPNDVTVDGEDVEAAGDGSSATFTVPEGVSTEINGDVSITTSAGSDDSAPAFLFHGFRNVLIDMRNGGSTAAPTVHNTSQVDKWGYWAAMHPYSGSYSSNAGDFTTGAEGDYIIVQNGENRSEIAGNTTGGWWNGYLSINLNAGDQWVPASSAGEAAGNFAVKFELSVVGEWSRGTLLMLMPETNYAARFEPWLNEDGENTPIAYTGWRTFTVPLTEFASEQGSGSAANTVSEVLGSDGAPDSAPSFRLINDSEEVVPAGLALAFDHIRVVRIAE